jgi:hypothetical protein
LVRNFVLSSASAKESPSSKLFSNITEESSLTRDEFRELLKTIDLGLRGLPATAQVRVAAFWWVPSGAAGPLIDKMIRSSTHKGDQ